MPPYLLLALVIASALPVFADSSTASTPSAELTDAERAEANRSRHVDAQVNHPQLALGLRHAVAVTRMMSPSINLPGPDPQPKVAPEAFGYESSRLVLRLGRTEYFLAQNRLHLTADESRLLQCIVAIHDIADDQPIDWLYINEHGHVAYSGLMNEIYHYVLSFIERSPDYIPGEAGGTVRHYTTNTAMPSDRRSGLGWQLETRNYPRVVPPIRVSTYTKDRGWRGEVRWMPLQVVQDRRGHYEIGGGWVRDLFPVNSFAEMVALRAFEAWYYDDPQFHPMRWHNRQEELGRLVSAKRDELHPTGRRRSDFRPFMEIDIWPLEDQVALALTIVERMREPRNDVDAKFEAFWREQLTQIVGFRRSANSPGGVQVVPRHLPPEQLRRKGVDLYNRTFDSDWGHHFARSMLQSVSYLDAMAEGTRRKLEEHFGTH